MAIEIFTNTVKKNLPLKTAIKNMVRKRIQNPQKQIKEARSLEEELIKPIVRRMETQLCNPDTIIIKKY